nr:hypothetical protein CFP56_06751 [Quercus suber]
MSLLRIQPSSFASISSGYSAGNLCSEYKNLCYGCSNFFQQPMLQQHHLVSNPCHFPKRGFHHSCYWNESKHNLLGVGAPTKTHNRPVSCSMLEEEDQALLL